MTESKNVLKSVRLTKTTFSFVDAYRGEGFNQKFENMVYDMIAKQDEIRAESAKLQRYLDYKLDEMKDLDKKIRSMKQLDYRLRPMIDELIKLLPG